MAKVNVDLRSILLVEDLPFTEESCLKVQHKIFPMAYKIKLEKICNELGLARNLSVRGCVTQKYKNGKLFYGALVGISYSLATGEIEIGYKFARTLVNRYEAGKTQGVAQLLYHEEGHALRYAALLGHRLHTKSRKVEEFKANEYALNKMGRSIESYAESIAIIALHHQRIFGEPTDMWAEEVLKEHSADKSFNEKEMKRLREEISKRTHY